MDEKAGYSRTLCPVFCCICASVRQDSGNAEKAKIIELND